MLIGHSYTQFYEVFIVCLLTIHTSTFCEVDIQTICNCIRLFVFLLLSCGSSLYILDTNQSSDWCFGNIFSPFMACLFIFCSAFCEQKFFILMKSNLSLFSLVACDFNVTFMKPLPNRGSQRFIPMFFYKSFIVVSLTLRSLIHFELICVYGI